MKVMDDREQWIYPTLSDWRVWSTLPYQKMAAAEVDLEMEDLFEDGNIDEDIDGQQALTDDANNEETPQAEDDQGLSILV